MHEATDDVRLEFADGRVVQRSMLIDYIYRPAELNHLSFLDYHLDTYNIKGTSHQQSKKRKFDDGPGDSRGRPVNARYCYQPEHPAADTQLRMSRSSNHNKLPSLIGQRFPSAKDPAQRVLYCILVLLLFKPWGSVNEVKAWSSTVENTFNLFYRQCPDTVRKRIINTQIERDSREAAEKQRSNVDSVSNTLARGEYMGDDDADMVHDDMDDASLSDSTALLPPVHQYSSKMVDYRDEAMLLAEQANLLLVSDASTSIRPPRLSPASVASRRNLDVWLQRMTQGNFLDTSSINPPSTPSLTLHPPTIDRDVNLPDIPSQQASPSFQFAATIPDGIDIPLDTIANSLLPEQRLAFNIVRSHFEATLRNEQPRQLMLKIMGEAGVGKSMVIRAIVTMFAAKRKRSWLRLGAFSGVAASNIWGDTLNSIAHIDVDIRKKLSDKKRDMLLEEWKGIHYLIIDEISQVCLSLLTLKSLSAILIVSPRLGRDSLQRFVVISMLPFPHPAWSRSGTSTSSSSGIFTSWIPLAIALCTLKIMKSAPNPNSLPNTKLVMYCTPCSRLLWSSKSK